MPCEAPFQPHINLHTPSPGALQVLPSGEEVKLQRNALEVLERPTAGEMVRRQGGRGPVVLARRYLLLQLSCKHALPCGVTLSFKTGLYSLKCFCRGCCVLCPPAGHV